MIYINDHVDVDGKGLIKMKNKMYDEDFDDHAVVGKHISEILFDTNKMPISDPFQLLTMKEAYHNLDG